MGWKSKTIVTAIYCISSLPVFSQREKPIVTIDFVKIEDGKTAEAMFFTKITGKYSGMKH